MNNFKYVPEVFQDRALSKLFSIEQIHTLSQLRKKMSLENAILALGMCPISARSRLSLTLSQGIRVSIIRDLRNRSKNKYAPFIQDHYKGSLIINLRSFN